MTDLVFDTLLELDGTTLELPSFHIVRFRATRVPLTPDRPQGLDYSFTVHAPDGERIGGFDNAHQVKGRPKDDPRLDHKHRFRTVRPYDYVDAATLLEDFWLLVDQLVKETT